MKIALVVLLAAVIVLVMRKPEAAESKEPIEVVQNVAPPNEDLPPTADRRKTDDSDAEFEALAKEVYNPDGSLKKLPKGVKYWTFVGTIRQHLGDGLLLVHCGSRGSAAFPRSDFAVVTRADLSKLPDGAQVEFLGCVAGTYQYTTVEGVLRTIPKLLCIPPEALPTPAPGEWMWEGRSQSRLDRPYRR